ncbi:MAG: hypothetical protein Q4C95_08040 [Planctomycetia bacterium]|nr:hypothetical protein [Planctomycetia bacterium]
MILTFQGFCVLKRKRLIFDTPTSKTLGVFIGFVELKGAAEAEQGESLTC